MKRSDSAEASSHSKNVFGLYVTRYYWQQTDFWFACFAAVLFWSSFKLFGLEPHLPVTARQFDLKLVYLVILFPILEEIVFRGLIQNAIQQLLLTNQLHSILISRISYANVITSLLFSAGHLWSHSVLWAMATFIPSLIFGYFKDQYQSLQPSIWLHIFYNSGFYLFL